MADDEDVGPAADRPQVRAPAEAGSAAISVAKPRWKRTLLFVGATMLVGVVGNGAGMGIGVPTLGTWLVLLAMGSLLLQSFRNPTQPYAGFRGRGLAWAAGLTAAVFTLTLLPPPKQAGPKQLAPGTGEPTVPAAGSSARTRPIRPSPDNPLGLASLPPATRFNEYGAAEALHPAQDALNAGDVGRAYDLFEARDRSADGPREKRFDSIMDVAWSQWTKSDPTSDYVERVERYWIPQVKALPNAIRADDEDGLRKLNISLNELAVNAGDAEGKHFSKPQREIVRRFFSTLAAKQQALYPSIRRASAAMLRRAWFRSDIDVSALGSKADVLRLTSGGFARNAQIEDTEQAAEENFRKLRFKRIEYHWSRYFGDGYHYDLKPPSDGIIAWWDEPNSEYHVMKAP